MLWQPSNLSRSTVLCATTLPAFQTAGSFTGTDERTAKQIASWHRVRWPIG